MFDRYFDKKVEKAVKEEVRNNLDIQFLKSMQKLDVKDGDVVVLKHPGVLKPETIKVLKEVIIERLKEWGYDVHVMIFEENTEIDILRKE